MKRKYVIHLFISCIFCIQGCACTSDIYKKPPAFFGFTFFDSPCPMVKHPAKVAFTSGAVIASPLMIPGIPIAFISSYFMNNSEEAIIFVIGPPILTGSLTGTAVGASCWTLFGWWWPKQYASPPNIPDKKKMEHPTPEIEKNGTSSKDP